MMASARNMNILLVEDDDVAAEAVCRGLAKNGVDFPVHIANDGIYALEKLRNIGDNNFEKPYIILLDLNMPRMNGFEFLHEIRGDDNLRKSIVFVLTTSDSDSDRSRAYHENIAGYMVKSAVGPQFAKLVQLLMDYHAAISLPDT